jgi:regulator of replication initiation timing
MQTKLLNAQAEQKQEILKLGKSLYQKAMKEVNAIVKENQRLLKQNERLTQENQSLKTKISAIDGNAIEKLRKEKDKEINRLQTECNKANSRAIHSDNIASKERSRADNAESLLSEILSVPEIRELWNSIQQNKKEFAKQMSQFIDSAKIAINAFAKDYEHSDFLPEQRENHQLGNTC